MRNYAYYNAQQHDALKGQGVLRVVWHHVLRRFVHSLRQR